MHRNLSRGIVAALLALVGSVLLGASPASAADVPQLSITIDDGEKSATAGDALTYTIAVQNLGTVAATGVAISQSLPEGMSFGTADSGGSEAQSLVSWTVDIAPGATTKLVTTMTIGTTPDELLRMATIACAMVSPTDPPIVCASDSDILPAGTAAAQGGVVKAHPAPTAFWWAIGTAAVLVVVVIAMAFVLVRRARRRIRSS